MVRLHSLADPVKSQLVFISSEHVTESVIETLCVVDKSAGVQSERVERASSLQ